MFRSLNYSIANQIRIRHFEGRISSLKRSSSYILSTQPPVTRDGHFTTVQITRDSFLGCSPFMMNAPPPKAGGLAILSEFRQGVNVYQCPNFYVVPHRQIPIETLFGDLTKAY